MLHENNTLGLFLYAWGYHDATHGRPGARLLATPQTFLDHLIGDLIGHSEEGRWFLMEFKRDRAGIADEVQKKPAREKLMDALWNNPSLAELSAYAHFACWLDEDISVQQYVVASGDPAAMDTPDPQLSFASATLDSQRTYDYLNEHLHEPHLQRPHELFQHGSGVTGEGMRQYLREVLAAHKGTLDPDVEVNALLGFVPASGSRSVLVPANFQGLLAAFAEALKISTAAARQQPQQGP